jgi:hypothetical protein
MMFSLHFHFLRTYFILSQFRKLKNVSHFVQLNCKQRKHEVNNIDKLYNDSCENAEMTYHQPKCHVTSNWNEHV